MYKLHSHIRRKQGKLSVCFSLLACIHHTRNTHLRRNVGFIHLTSLGNFVCGYQPKNVQKYLSVNNSLLALLNIFQLENDSSLTITKVTVNL